MNCKNKQVLNCSEGDSAVFVVGERVSVQLAKGLALHHTLAGISRLVCRV